MIAIGNRSALACHRAVRSGRSWRAAADFRRTVPAAQRPDLAEPGSSEVPGAPSSSQPEPAIRELKAWGVRVIESNETLPGPETEKDFWEGEQFEKFGEIMQKYFLPGLVVLGLVCGAIAAQTYNEGADTFMTVASPDALPRMVPADLVVVPPAVQVE